jgi:hypothetical protein
MQKPRRISGWCPHYDAPSGICYLSEQSHSSGVVSYNCKSDTNCKRCGNYEAWARGTNYKNK